MFKMIFGTKSNYPELDVDVHNFCFKSEIPFLGKFDKEISNFFKVKFGA